MLYTATVGLAVYSIAGLFVWHAPNLEQWLLLAGVGACLLGHLGLAAWSRSQAAPETYVLTPYVEVVPGAAPLDAESAARLQAELKGPVDARNIKHGYAWIGSTLSLQDLVSGIADLDRAGLPLDADQQAELKPLVQDTRARFGEMMAVQREILDGEAELDADLAAVIAALPPERQAEVQARWKQRSGGKGPPPPGGPKGPPPPAGAP